MKKYIPIFLLIIFVVPSVAFASWWNPFSWFKKKTKPNIEISTQVEQGDSVVKEQKVAENKVPEKKVPIVKKNIFTKKKPVEIETEQVQPQIVINNPMVAILDICHNIEGIQTRAPEGMYANSGNCFQLTLPANQQLTQIQESIDQIVENTAPVVETPPIIDNTPKEVSFDNLITGEPSNVRSNIVQFGFSRLQKDDKITLTFNSENYVQNVDERLSARFEIQNLNPETNYPYKIKIERGNEYAYKNGTLKTGPAFECLGGLPIYNNNVSNALECTNFSSKTIEITKINYSVVLYTSSTVRVKIKLGTRASNSYQDLLDKDFSGNSNFTEGNNNYATYTEEYSTLIEIGPGDSKVVQLWSSAGQRALIEFSQPMEWRFKD